jgi:hypothetical protein
VRSKLNSEIWRNLPFVSKAASWFRQMSEFHREKLVQFREIPCDIRGGQSDPMSEFAPSAAVSTMPRRPHTHFHCNAALIRRTRGQSLGIKN